MYLFATFGYIGGNIAKNFTIGMTGGIFIGILVMLMCAKLFLMYKESHDLIQERFVKDADEGNHPPKVGAVKKPLEFYIPKRVSVMKWQPDGQKDTHYLLNPKTVPEVIDAGLAVIMLKLRPKKEYSYEDLTRVRAIFYGIIVIEIIIAILGLGLSTHIMPPR